MNDRSFLTVERDVAQRRRRLNALAGAQLGGLITMTLTLAHLIAVYLGLMALVQPWWTLIVGNALGLSIGVQWGRRRPVDVQGDLYRMDRAYALGEKLSTIHEIRQRDDRNPYLRLLYGRVRTVDLSPKRALRASRRQRQGWATFGGVTSASVALLVMWFVGVPPLSVSSLFAHGPDSGRPFVASQETSGSTPGSSRGQGAPNPQGASPGATEDRAASPCDDDGGRSPSILTRDERSDCDDARSSSDEGSNGSRASSEGADESDDARMSVQQLRRELEDVQRRMASGSLSGEDAQRELERLAQQARSPSIEDLLRQAARSQTPSEMQRRLREALDELQRQSEQAQQGSGPRGLDPDADLQRRSDERTDGNANGSGRGQTEGQNRPTEEGAGEAQPGPDDPNADGQPEAQAGEGPQRSGSGSGPNEGEDGASSADDASSENAGSGTTSESGEAGSQQDGQSQSESGQGQSGDQASSEEAQGSQPGDTGSQGQTDQGDDSGGTSQRASSATEGESDSSEDARPDSGAQGEQEGAGSPGGSSPGTGPGGNQEGQDSKSDGRPSTGLRVQAPDLPGDVETLRALMTKGVPFDVSGEGTADGAPRLELDPDRVETLLRSRDLPPALRDLVRAYFLSLAEGE